MNKLTYIFIFLFTLAWASISAQPVSSFGFESRIGTYEEISGGTVVGAGLLDKNLANMAFNGSTTGTKVLNTAQGFPIGFDFNFNNTVMNRFAIGSHGYIVLGKDQVTIDPTRYMFLDPEEGKKNVIGTNVLSDLLGSESTQISYKLIGNAPNRILVVQFKNLGFSLDFSGSIRTAANLQIRLYENSGNIELVFKNWVNSSDKNISVRLGVMGSLPNDRHLRTNTIDDWTKTEKNIERPITWIKSSLIPDGLTFTFLAPEVCEKPAGQPTNLKLTPTSIKVDGSFEGIPTADNYLVLMTESEKPSEAPTNGKFYKAEEKLGNGTVITFDTLKTFEMPETLVLDGAKNYYFHVYAVNSFCSFGPVYNTVSPLTGKISTMPVKPDALEIVEGGYNDVTLKATKNGTDQQIIIARISTPAKDKLNNITLFGNFGKPTGELNVGDEINGGGTVVYKGSAEGAIKVEGLTENSVYYFGAWSINNQGEYSTTSAGTRILTWGKMPYNPALGDIKTGPNEFGWKIEGGTFRISPISSTERYQLDCDIRVADLNNGKVNSITTQWMLLEKGVNRVLFDYRMTTWSRPTGDLPYNEWEVNDLFEVQVSENGTDFTTIYKVDKTNAPQLASKDSWATMNIPFDKFNGKKVKVRLYWKCYKAVKLIVTNLQVEQKPDCEYPVDVTVDKASLIGSNALVSWTPKGEEDNWEIQYRKVGTDKWSAPIEANRNPFLITILPDRSNLELQVRAKCSLISASAWSKSITFSTGWNIPFTEGFDTNVLPEGWNLEFGMITDSTTFATSFSKKSWKLENNSLYIDYTKAPNDWVILPMVDLGDGSANYKLDFDLTRTKISQTVPDNAYIAVVISANEGTKFSDKNIIKKWSQADGTFDALINETLHSINLKGYKGKVRLAFFATSNLGFDDKLTLDNISILETCPSAKNIVLSEVTSDGAKVNWKGEADEWRVFVRKAGETTQDFKAQAKNEMVLADLTPKTTYEIGITKTCGPEDQAKLVITSFTTLSLEPCLQVTGITVTPSQQSAVIGWTGDAAKYNVKFRQTGNTDWIERTTETASIELKGLETETEYEYTIQSVCSDAEGDVSTWTEVAKFSTIAVTCFPPTDVVVTPSHISANVTWAGEAENYEVAYRLETVTEWTSVQVMNAKTTQIKELNPQATYSLRVRSVCSESDASAWSTTVNFTTNAIPPCAEPTNLRASGITDTTADLAWDADENNLTWDVRYREGTVTSWTMVEKLTEKIHRLTGLTPNTAYLWSVKATCDEERTSLWARQGDLTTSSTNIENLNAESLRVYALDGIINIFNPQNIKLDRILLFGMDGKALKEFNISSDENVLIPVNLGISKVIVKVLGENFNSSYTLIL